MSKQVNALEELKQQVLDTGFTVREWAADAGLPWQSVYRRIANPLSTRFGEYEKLLKSMERLKKKARKCQG